MRTFHLDTLIIRLAMDASQFDNTLDRRLKRATTEMEKWAVRKTRLGRNLSMYVSVPLAAMGAIAVREFSRFNQAMTEAESIMGGVSDSVRADLVNMARSLALEGEVPFDPTELAHGFQELAAAGFNAQQSMAALPTVSKFATAGAFGLAEAVRHLSDAMFSFGLMSDIPLVTAANMEKVANQLAFLANKTTISVREAAIAMKTDAAQQAKLLGMELEDLIGMLGAYAQAGKKAQNAGHMAGRAMRLLADSARKHGDVFQRFGIDVIDESTGKYHRFADIIEDMEEAFADLTPEQVISALNELGFETLAQKSILPLIGMSKNMKEIADEAGNATEVIETMAGIQMTSFQNQTKLTLNHLKVMGEEIGELLSPAILLLYEGVKLSVDAFMSMGTATKTAAVAIAFLATATGPAVLLAGQLAHAVNNLVITFGAARMAAVGMAGAYTAAVAAIAVLIYATYRFASGQAKANAEMERAMEIEERRAKASRKRIGEVAAAVRHMRPEDAESFMKPYMERALDDIDSAQKEISSKSAQIKKMVEDTYNKMEGRPRGANEPIDPVTQWMAEFVNQKFIDQLNNQIDAARQRLNMAEEEANALDQMFRDLGLGTEAAGDAANQLVADIDALSKEFDKQIATVGMSSEEIKIWELVQAGANATEERALKLKVANIRAAEENNEKIQESIRLAERLSESAKSTALGFREQIAALNRSSEEMTVWRLHAEGLRGAEFEMVRAAARAAEAARKHHDIMEEGKKIIEKYRTPMEELVDTHKNLLRLRDAGAFDTKGGPEAFRRAWDDALKTYKEARMELEKPIKIGGDDFSGVAGSAEHLKRVEEYRSALAESKRMAVDMARVAVPPHVARPGVPGGPRGAVPGAAGAPTVSRGREAVDRSLAAHYTRIEGLLAAIVENTSSSNVVKLDTLGVEELV